MLWEPITYIAPAGLRTLTVQPTSARDLAQAECIYQLACERALDYLAGGTAQRLHLQNALYRRLGQSEAPPTKPDGATHHETDSGRLIRTDRTELVTLPLVESVVSDLAVLYAADDLRREYQMPDGSEAVCSQGSVTEVLGDYQSPARGGLSAKLLQIDEHIVLLRTSLMLVRWNNGLRELNYDVLPPHWVKISEHPQWPLDPRMAYAVAYAESSAMDAKGQQSGFPTWCAYVRPPFDTMPPIDPRDAMVHDYPRGRIVRYRQAAPWPLPEPGSENILQDGMNPMVLMKGWEQGHIWSPLIWHWARPPLESVFLPVQDDLVRFALELDMAWSLVLYLANSQSHGQPVMTGGGEAPVALGANSLIQIDDPNGKFEFVSPGANIQGHLEAIRALIRTHAMLRKMAPDAWSDQRPSIQTGPAKLLEQVPLTETRRRRILTADAWEARRFDVERVLLNHHAELGIPWECKQVLHWGELRVPVDRSAQAARLAQEKAQGLITQLDAIMERWNLSREDAERKLAAIREEQGKPSAAPSQSQPEAAPAM